MTETPGAQGFSPVDEMDAALAESLEGMTYERPRPRQYLVKLPGQHKLATMCWLVAGDHSLLVEAFVMRRPDENHQKLYDLLLTRNSRMYGVGWAIDSAGDVFLVGRLPLSAVTPDEIDRLLGSVLSYADDTFDTLLEIGFGSAIRREWAWRSKNGESLANLQAFARFAGGEDRQGAGGEDRQGAGGEDRQGAGGEDRQGADPEQQ